MEDVIFNLAASQLSGKAAVVVPVVTIAVSSVLDAFVPLPQKKNALWYLKKGLGYMAFNFKNAKNAE